MLMGNITREAFADTNFSWWFVPNYNNYEVNSILLDSISSSLNSLNIIVVLGTWCSDSRREVPGFLKILDYVDFPGDKLKMIAVDRQKKGSGNEVEGLSIELVPTFIFFKGDSEIGRIIETPAGTLESDIKNILQSKQSN